MTMKQLLGGAAAAALLAGASYAEPDVSVSGGDFNGQVLAIETLTADTELSGNLVLSIDVLNQFVAAGAGANIEMRFNFTNAEFTIPVPDGSLDSDDATGNCAWSEDPTLDGGQGQDTVMYVSLGQVNQCTAGNLETGDILVTLPITVLDASEPVGLEVVFTPIVNPGGQQTFTVVVDTDNFYSYDNALTFSIAAGDDGDNELTAVGTAFLNLDPDNGILGSLALAYDDGLYVDLTNTLDDEGIDPSELIEGAVLTVSFDSVVGIESLELGGEECDLSGTTFTCELDGAAIDLLAGGSSDIVFALDGDDAVSQQTPSASLAVEAVDDPDVNGDAEVFDGLGATDLAEITLDDGLDIEAIDDSNFSWVRFGSGGTESNFRIQFASAAEAAAVTEVRVTNIAGNNVPAGTTTLEAGTANDGFQIQGATVTFNSRALGAASGHTGNADITGVTLQFDETALDPADVEDLPILRQLINRNTANFVATPGLASDRN